MECDLKRLKWELKKWKSREFVKKNYDDILHESYIHVSEGLEMNQAIESAIRSTKKAIALPKLKKHGFESLSDEYDIAAPEEKPFDIPVKTLTRKQRKTLYQKIRNLSQITQILNRLNIRVYPLSSTNGKYIEAIQVFGISCPICGTRKPCFSIYRTTENGKPRFSYACHTIRTGEHYNQYPNNLDGIFMSLLGLSKIKARKLVFQAITELIE